MQVLRLHNRGNLRLHTEPDPIPRDREVTLRITAVGLCGSDLHWYTHAGIGDAQLRAPLVLGHEFAAVIDSGVQAGQHVAVDPAIPCDRCSFCRNGHPNLCKNLVFAGHDTTDGALCEKMTWPQKCLYPLPEKLGTIEGAMLEPLGVAIHAVELSHLRKGMRVGIFGCGPIGLLIVQLARLRGARQIIASDVLEHRLEAAQSMGAGKTVAATSDDAVAAMWAATNNNGVDIAFEAAGENEAVQAAIHAVRPGGQAMLIGIPATDETIFKASTARRKGLTIKLIRRMQHTYPQAMHLVHKGFVDVKSLVTHRFGLGDFKKAFRAALNREGIKVIIEPNQQAHT